MTEQASTILPFEFVQNGYTDLEALAARVDEAFGPIETFTDVKYTVAVVLQTLLEGLPDTRNNDLRACALIWAVEGMVACAKEEGLL